MGTIPRRDMTVVVHLVCLSMVAFGGINLFLQDRSPFVSSYDDTTDAAFCAYGIVSWCAMIVFPTSRFPLLTAMFIGLFVSLAITITCLNVSDRCGKHNLVTTIK